MQKLIDSIIEKRNIKSILIGFFVKLIIYFVINFVEQYYFRLLEALGKNKVLKSLYGSLLDKDISFYEKQTTGNITSMLINDSSEIASWMSVGQLIVLIQVLSLLFTIIMMFRYSSILTIIILVLISISFVMINIIAKRQAEVAKKIFTIKGEINQFLIESIKSIKLIKPLKKEIYFKDNFKMLIDDKKFPEDKKYSALFGLYISMMSLLIMILPLIAVGIGAFLTSKGMMTIGSILSVYSLTSQLQEPISVLASSFSDRKTIMILVDRLKEVIHQEELYKNDILIDGFKELYININSFNYGDKKILKNTNIKMSANEIIIIKGQSGSGKSTLGNLILGILDIEDGSIRINNNEIGNINKNNLWDYVLGQGQDHLILQGSLYDNLTLGDKYNNAEINKVIDIACLDDFIKKYGLNKKIEESGKNLSGGQKQRISLARILLRKPELLIIDEPTSSLDNETSKNLSKNLIKYSNENNISLIIISHRNHFDKYADNIYCIKDR